MIQARPGTRPNVLLLTTHDSGRHFGCYGKKTVQTPNIDALAADGICFEQCFSAAPICSAARASMLTGKYPQHHGLLDLTGWGDRLNPGERLLSHYLREAGYQTAMCGTHHIGDESDAETHGFDHLLTPHKRNAPDFATAVIEYLDHARSVASPFLLQVGFRETHTPFDAFGVRPDVEKGIEVPGYLAPDDVNTHHLAALQGALRHVDRAIGEILNALNQFGLSGHTLVVFNTDHGIEMPRAKWTLHDPGLEAALVARLPGTALTGGKRYPHLVSQVDLVPTILEWVGLEVPEGLDGKSHAAFIDGRSNQAVRSEIFAYYFKTHSRCVRTDRYKLIRHFQAYGDYTGLPVTFADILAKKVMPRVWLYDLLEDPWELTNLSESPDLESVRQDLDDCLWRWLEACEDSILRAPPIPHWWIESQKDYQEWKRTHV